MTMAASQLPASFGKDIEAGAKLLWPTWTAEVEYVTDDHLAWYADLLRLCGDPCTSEGEWYEIILCYRKGYSSVEKAGDMLHRDTKNMILRRPVEEITAG